MLKQHRKYLFMIVFQGSENLRYLNRIVTVSLGVALLFGLVFYFIVPEARIFPLGTEDQGLITRIRQGNNLLLKMVLWIVVGMTHPVFLLLASLMGAWWVIHGLMVQLTRVLYDLSTEEAEGFVLRMFYGLPSKPPKGPTLVVRQGQIISDSSRILRTVGGPGFLSVGHESAAVLSRKGRIVRAVGPGFYPLKSFETVWDTLDLRPQRREVKVETYTRDGIPIYCEAEVRFHLDNQQGSHTHALPFTEASESAALHLTTEKVVLASDKGTAFTRWTDKMSKGILDGAIREWIERYRLDDLISPKLAGQPPIAKLQEDVEKKVRRAAESMGVWVERVEIKSLRPEKYRISEQWLELWRSDWDLIENELKAQAKALGSEEVQLARLRARANLLTQMTPNVKDSNIENLDVRTLRLSHFMEAVQAMTDIQEPEVRASVFHQAKELHTLIKNLEQEMGSIGSPLPSQTDDENPEIETTQNNVDDPNAPASDAPIRENT